MDQVYSLVRLPEILHNYQHCSQPCCSLYPPPSPPPQSTDKNKNDAGIFQRKIGKHSPASSPQQISETFL